MRYLTLAADYTQSPVRDDVDGPCEPEDLDLPQPLADDLRRWNERYREIIPLAVDERRRTERADRIALLDDEGRRLAEAVAAAVGGGAKVRYYSEGLLRNLT